MDQALAYADLPDIDAVKTRGPDDDDLFRELAEVLERHGALNRFSVTLLHTHFPINRGEVLLETTDREKREQLIRPVAMSGDEQTRTIETSWRFGPNGETLMTCRCLMTPDGKVHQGHFPTP